MSTVIKAEGVGKAFKIYKRPADRLKALFKSRQATAAYFTSFWALRDISFEVREGESVGIIGCNGSGKSTLLQLMASILKPTVGTLEVNGRIAALLELGSGFNPEFTGEENVYLNAAILGLSKKEIQKKFNDIVSFADIGEFIQRPVKTYSSGMLIRLAFSVMVHVSPDILIIDEALAVGDIFFQQKCIRFLKDNFSHKTKIFVAHDMNIISSLCDRVIYLEKGRIQYDGHLAGGIENYIKAFHAQPHLEAAHVPSIDKVVDWRPISEEQLSGALEVKIKGFQLSVNERPITSDKAFVRYQDRMDVKVLFYASKPQMKAILGYLVCDKYGNYVFGQNKFDQQKFYLLEDSGFYSCHYTFFWPDVRQGQYTLTPGIGEGDNPDVHTVQCWAHSIILLDCVSAHAVHGLFNNPLTALQINTEAVESTVRKQHDRQSVIL